MLTIQLPEHIEKRLNALARRTGCTRNALAREAIVQRIADLEDCCLADMRARKRREPIPLTEVERQLGLRR